MAGVVRVNPSLLEDLQRAGQLDGPLLDAAGRTAELARGLARTEAYESGAYHDGIHGDEVGEREDGAYVGRVNADEFKSRWIEFGYTRQDGVHIPPKAILRRAAEAAGLQER